VSLSLNDTKILSCHPNNYGTLSFGSVGIVHVARMHSFPPASARDKQNGGKAHFGGGATSNHAPFSFRIATDRRLIIIFQATGCCFILQEDNIQEELRRRSFFLSLLYEKDKHTYGTIIYMIHGLLTCVS
jgi:hypothetical protein